MLFEQYPAIKEAYDVSMSLTQIFNNRCAKEVAITKPAHWYNEVEWLNCKFFNSVIKTMQNNYATIIVYYCCPIKRHCKKYCVNRAPGRMIRIFIHLSHTLLYGDHSVKKDEPSSRG